MVVTNVATHREDLYRKYFVFSLLLYFTVNFKIQVHIHVLTNQLRPMESFVRR